ncbi:MAG: tetratricopeptide repeat protein [Deltaproteobacteria bacterium]|nr:tetratricopeptide repeat protein [Deltaproteobacteria bacterium]
MTTTHPPSRQQPPTKVDVSTADFDWQVIEESHSRPVVVDFWAPWCGPCRMLGPVLEKLAAEDGGAWLLAKVNSDENPQLAQQFGISGIPAVKAIVGGQVVDEFVGALPPQQIRAWLNGILPSESDKLADAGQQALKRGERDVARRAFEAARALDTGHGRAAIGLAALAVQDGDLDQAEALLAGLPIAARDRNERVITALRMQIEAARGGDTATLRARIDADPNDHEARIALGRQHAAASDWEPAFAAWLEVVRNDRDEARDAARKAMVEAFAVCTNPALVKRWRNLLSMELFS